MSLNRSTGLRNKLLDTGSFKSVMNLCFINIYSGARPASADDAVPGGCVLLAVISDNGGGSGLNWDAAAAAGALLKSQTQTWSEDSILADGTAGWFRIYEATDTPAGASTTKARADGTIGTSGADLNLSSVNLTAGTPLTLSNASQFTMS
ncbi:MAG: hypothetical protein HY749_16345 [Gammaproteobacteria bacterium]|nr:hypothetical protein [Gammaproteobacteria bacterium]